MIYDTLLDLFKLIFGTIEFFKPFAVPLGILVLLLKQNNIKKVINGRLPKRFRDTQSSDIYDIMRDVQEIKYDVKLLKSHQGVVGEWSSTQLNGQKTTQIPLYRRFFLFSQTVTNRKRRVLKMRQYLLKLTSRRFLLAILAVIIPVINQEFGIDLNTATIIAIISALASFIIGESHVDAKKIKTNPNDQNYSH